MLNRLDGFPDNVLAIAASGTITRADYDKVLIPAVEAALKQHDKLNLYYEIGSDFAGVEVGAAWEDFMVGVSHWTRWQKIAVVTDVAWIANTMNAFGFMMPATLKTFPLAAKDEARRWIVE